ncbi:MAG: hypothetical protein ISQ60_00405 [Gammaproteobacteria bacterium]|nr:hypothetical protein [Gammaproteobacteria bacterium]
MKNVKTNKKKMMNNSRSNLEKTKIGLEVRKRRKLFPDELEKIKRANLDGYGKLEAWTALGTNKQLAYSTHGAMRFFGKFPPPIATHLIDQYASNDSLVIDPMSGSGSTAVECLLKGVTCKSFDVNPMMLMLTRVKTTHLSIEVINKHFTKIKKNYVPVSFSKHQEEFEGLRDPYHFFLKDTLNSLLGIRTQILKIEDIKIQEFFMICFLSIIRRVSRATTQQGRTFLDVETAEANPFPFFEKKVENFKFSVSEIPKNNKKIIIEERNLIDSNLVVENKNSADLIILHPPYFNAYKYSSITSLETFWMGINHANIRKNEIREFFKVGKPEKYHLFVEDMSLALTNALSMLKKGGHLGFMMGDTVIKGQYIPVMKETLDHAGIKKSDLISVALRVPKYTEASWAASQRRSAETVGITLNDFILVIKK